MVLITSCQCLRTVFVTRQTKTVTFTCCNICDWDYTSVSRYITVHILNKCRTSPHLQSSFFIALKQIKRAAHQLLCSVSAQRFLQLTHNHLWRRDTFKDPELPWQRSQYCHPCLVLSKWIFSHKKHKYDGKICTQTWRYHMNKALKYDGCINKTL